MNYKKLIYPLAFVVAAFFVIVLVASGALYSISGIIYSVLILGALTGLGYIGNKIYSSYSEEKRIQDIVNDPEKLYGKLKENSMIIEDGKEVEISLKEDKETGKKFIDIKLGKKVNQDWRKRFETVAKKEDKAKDQAKPQPKAHGPRKQKV